MAKQELKFVLGKVVADQPADICFYEDVDYWNCNDFLWEFDWLVDKAPSKIRIHINSCGGNCVDGIGVFSKIIDCKIPTECIVDGIAASMGSVIWAAGDEVFMKDYALLMIHNPFIDSNGAKVQNQVTEAFTKQLKTIYAKRFGFDDEKIETIMNGEPGNDGTFFTAIEASEAGFLAKDHIIETPKAERGQIEAALKGVSDIAKIKAVMDLAVFKPQPQAIIEKENENNSNSPNFNQMKDNEMTVFAALLGMASEKATVEGVTASIKALQAKSEKYDTLKASYDTLKEQHSNMETEYAAAKASVQNLTTTLNETKAALQTYKDAETKAFDEKVDALVEAAINDCKINKDDKASWVEMAKNNFDLAKKALDSIPARDNLGNIVGKENREEAKDGMKSEAQKLQAKVDEVVGNFEFRKLD